MTGVAALALCAGFTACSHDDFTFSEEEYVQNQKEMVYAQYQQAFINAFGEPAKNHTWGFQMPTATTRSITINGDTYDSFTFPTTEELAAAFPAAIPADAKTDAELETEWKGKNAVDEAGNEIIAYGWPVQMWDLYAIYKNMVGIAIKNIKVTEPGEYTVGHSYANPANQVYNVYISVGKGNNLTLKRNGAEHVNFYILSGNITIDKDFGECGGIISVASGATVNDQRSHIAHNDGIKVYNRGTYNATNTTAVTSDAGTYCYAIGNNVKFYNEKTFTVSGALAYNSGAGNTAWFYNRGEGVRLTAPSMTLNSTCNFFSDGVVDIEGETFVTKDGIVWINNGHYTTGSITWSAKNSTFYNYCQLIVKGNAHMYDGEFNLMQNSYMEAETAEMDNFIVNMGGNSGINIKGNVRIIAQGDGTFQGFKSFGTTNYVLIGGKVTIDSHKKTLSIEPGITYSINQIEIVRNGSVVTEAQLQSEGSGDYPVLDLQGTECPYGQLTVTPQVNGCGADWIEPNVKKVRVICEDMFAKEKGDFDFNDAVFDLTLDENGKVTWIDLIHTGAEFDIYVDGKEIHDALDLEPKTFGSRKSVTAKNSFAPSAGAGTKYPVEIEVYAVRNFTYTNEEGEKETVNDRIELKADQGKAPGKIQVKSTFEIPAERVPIDSKYESFKAWVQDASIDWEE